MWLCTLGRRVGASPRGARGSTAKTPRQRQYLQHRWFSYQSVLLAIVVLGALLPLLFTRASFLAVDGVAICCSINPSGWGFFGRRNSRELTNALKLVFLEAEGADVEMNLVEAAPESFSGLVADSFSHPDQDIKTFALKTKATLLKMDHKVQLARLQESVFWRLASDGIPKSMHCLSLRLKEEYYINALARSPLPPPEYVSRLDNQSLVHIAVLTDNVLAASVVVSSTVKRSANPEDLVFHIVTDKKTYASMHSWFALNPVFPAVVVVKGLHQFDWPSHVGLAVLETVKLHQTTWEHVYHARDDRRIEALSSSPQSILTYLRIHLPELFPGLDKVILLHDDTVVCRDLSPLWSLDLQGKVNGAVNTVKGNGDSCVGDTFGDYLNFSRTEISTQFDRHECAWIGGINVFDLKAWRQTNISKAYQHWLKLNLESGFLLWEAGTAPPALIAFEGHTHPIDPSWHLWGLGLRRPAEESLPSAAVLHFSGPAKPWLAVGFPELRNLWEEHVDYSNELVKSCAGVEREELGQREEGPAFSLWSSDLE